MDEHLAFDHPRGRPFTRLLHGSFELQDPVTNQDGTFPGIHDFDRSPAAIIRHLLVFSPQGAIPDRDRCGRSRGVPVVVPAGGIGQQHHIPVDVEEPVVAVAAVRIWSPVLRVNGILIGSLEPFIRLQRVA